MRAHVLEPTLTGRRLEVLPDRQPRRNVGHIVVWTTFAVLALLLMDVLDLTVYGVVIPVAGVLLGTLIQIPDQALGALLAFFAGFCLCVGAAELLPEAHRRDRSRWIVVATVGGAVAIYFWI